ncbi:MAG: hypothetical protein ACLKAL_13270, partial [Alkaliphilus sp.]
LVQMKFISRFLETFSLTGKLKEKAHSEDSFEDIKIAGEENKNKNENEKAKYKIQNIKFYPHVR